MEDEKIICYECGKEIEGEEGIDYIYAVGEIVCSDCFYEKYFVCEHCESIHYIDEGIIPEDNQNVMYCEDCACNHLVQCDDCGGYFENDNLIYIENVGYICESCYESGEYGFCESCGETYHINDLTEINGYYYCNNCAEEEQDLIRGYHDHKGNYVEHKTEKEKDIKNSLCFGFELEVENKRHEIGNEEMAATINDIMQIENIDPDGYQEIEKNNLVVFERDGSLSNGFEIISQPMTYNFLVANKNKIETMLKSLSQKGFASHDTTTCGLHIHLTRKYFTPNELDKFELIIEKFKKELLVFSRRERSQAMHWAKFISDETSDAPETKDIKIDYIKKNKSVKYNRYFALNTTNYNTIEFRLLRGTLKYSTFLAGFQLLNNISKIVKRKSVKNIEELNFNDIVYYGRQNKELIEYCKTKNLIEGGAE